MLKANVIHYEASDVNFVASQDWLDKFMKRNGLSLVRRTTVGQKIPS